MASLHCSSVDRLYLATAIAAVLRWLRQCHGSTCKQVKTLKAHRSSSSVIAKDNLVVFFFPLPSSELPSEPHTTTCAVSLSRLYDARVNADFELSISTSLLDMAGTVNNTAPTVSNTAIRPGDVIGDTSPYLGCMQRTKQGECVFLSSKQQQAAASSSKQQQAAAASSSKQQQAAAAGIVSRGKDLTQWWQA
jgi:hypothetical protein